MRNVGCSCGQVLSGPPGHISRLQRPLEPKPGREGTGGVSHNNSFATRLPSLLDGRSQDFAAVRVAWCPVGFAHWLVRPQACDKGATFDCLHCVPHSLTADVALGTSRGFPNAFSLEFVH